MQYISEYDCLSKIEEGRINRSKSANVYVYATNKHMGISFAYSDAKHDEVSLVKLDCSSLDNIGSVWQELLVMAKVIKEKFKVILFEDNVRSDLS